MRGSMKKILLISWGFFCPLVAMETKNTERKLTIAEIPVEDYESDMSTIEVGVDNIVQYLQNKPSTTLAPVSVTDQFELLNNLKLFAKEASNLDLNLKSDYTDLKVPYDYITGIVGPKIKELRLDGLNGILTHSEDKSESKEEKKKWWNIFKKAQQKSENTNIEDKNKTVARALSHLLNKGKVQSDDWTVVLQEIQTWVEREYTKRVAQTKEEE